MSDELPLVNGRRPMMRPELDGNRIIIGCASSDNLFLSREGRWRGFNEVDVWPGRESALTFLRSLAPSPPAASDTKPENWKTHERALRFKIDELKHIAVKLAAFCCRVHGRDEGVAEDVREEAIKLAHEFKEADRLVASAPAVQFAPVRQCDIDKAVQWAESPEGKQVLSDAKQMPAASDRLDSSGWRPIESAPLNQSVLVFIPNAEHYGPGIYRAIRVNMRTDCGWQTTGWMTGRDLPSDTQPTHWMPLPNPPEVK